MVAGGHRIIAGDGLNLVVLLSSSSPTHGHILVTSTLIDNRTTSTVDRTVTTIELRLRGLSVILTLQPKFLNRVRSYVDL